MFLNMKVLKKAMTTLFYIRRKMKERKQVQKKKIKGKRLYIKLVDQLL